MADNSNKAKYWWAVLYPENMRPDWQDAISEIVQFPYAYCIHNQCNDEKGDLRKVHLHLIIAFRNTTTYNHALSVFKELSAPGLNCVNNCKRILNIRHAYDYLIHDTEDAKKKKKHLYAISERITGNNFDIGAFEVLSSDETQDILFALGDLIITRNFRNYRDFWVWLRSDPDTSKEQISVAARHHGFLEALTRGNYLKSKESSSF